MISIIQMLAEMDASIFCQEIGQAVMWLTCAFIGWFASSFVLHYLGCKKGLKSNKATAGSDAFRQEVALYAEKTCVSASAQHFGLSETKVQQYCSQLKGSHSPVNTVDDSDSTTAAEETPSVVDGPLLTSPSSHAGHVLLEHYDVFHSQGGAWSGPLEEQVEDTSVQPSTPKYAAPPLSAFEDVKAEEFFQGSESISLWLVPDGYVYDPCAQGWSTDAATI